VLIYWLTTNVWSMVQQRVIIRRMEETPATPTTATPAGPAPGAKPIQRGPGKPPAPKPIPKPVSAGEVVLPPGGAISPGAARQAPRRPTNNRSKKRKKGRR
jgi:membrane protein insertase Oxa1/YidC/SpoIIIJ